MKRAFQAILAAVFLAIAIAFVWAIIGGSPASGERGDAAQLTRIIVAVFCFLMTAILGWRALSGGIKDAGYHQD
jgi:preprotein translocase subunit SecG